MAVFVGVAANVLEVVPIVESRPPTVTPTSLHRRFSRFGLSRLRGFEKRCPHRGGHVDGDEAIGAEKR